MNRTRTRDAIEKKIIKKNREIVASIDYECTNGFEFKEFHIHNPYMNPLGLHEVNPEEYYGEAYINWYKSF